MMVRKVQVALNDKVALEFEFRIKQLFLMEMTGIFSVELLLTGMAPTTGWGPWAEITLGNYGNTGKHLDSYTDNKGMQWPERCLSHRSRNTSWTTTDPHPGKRPGSHRKMNLRRFHHGEYGMEGRLARTISRRYCRLAIPPYFVAECVLFPVMISRFYNTPGM